MSRVLLFWIATLLVCVGAFLIWTLTMKPDARPSGTMQVMDAESGEPKPSKMTEFELIDQLGRRVNSKEYDGHVWAASFFFSRCPSTCYQQNIMLQQLDKKFGDDGLKLVSITCDPSFDTPVVLANYANRFGANAERWRFLSPVDGSAQYLSRIGNDMLGIAVDPSGAEPTHTDRVVLFDRNGKQHGAFSVMRREQFNALEARIEELLSDAPNTSEITPEAATIGATDADRLEAAVSD